MKVTSWFLGKAAPAPRLRLVCFSHAGGSATGYLPWQGQLGDGVDVVAVQLPGRGGRFGEPCYTAIAPLAAVLAEEIAADAAVPFAFFGHSLGALLAFETARRLRDMRAPQPLLLVASGCDAPRYRTAPRKLHLLDDAGLTEALRAYDGTPPEVLANAELMALLLPMIRADFTLVDTYAAPSGPALDLPIAVFAGRQDEPDRTTHVERWREETTGSFSLHWFDGGHFFLHSAQEQVLRRLAADLAGVAARQVERCVVQAGQ